MPTLIAGLTLLLCLQQLHANATLRPVLIRRYGLGAFRLGAGSIALVALALILVGKTSVEYIYVWLPPVWLHLFVLPLMFVAFLLLAAEFLPSNIRRLTNRPILWSVVLWSATHLLVKGDLSGMTLFGGFGLLALLEAISQRGRVGRQPVRALPWISEVHIVAVAGVLFIVLFYLHASLFGVSPSMMSRSYF
jgi:uncharacterized membrane protein